MSERSEVATETRRLVVGIDGSSSATHALEWAGQLAVADGCEVVVAHMFTPSEAEVTPDRYDELMRTIADDVASTASDLLEPLGVRHRVVVEPGAAEDLLVVGDRHDADLLVVGPHVTGAAATHLDSTAHHLAHRSTRPFAIVPERPRVSSSFDRIVVGVDGSTGSAAALEWCADLATACGAAVIAVESFEPLVEWVPESDPNSIMQARREELDASVAPMRAKGIEVRTEVVRDIHPVAALASVIERECAALAVVGRRGSGGFSGLVLGRVPEQLVHHSRVPVVVVPS